LNSNNVFPQELWFLYSPVVGVSKSYRVLAVIASVATKLVVVLANPDAIVAVINGSWFRVAGLIIKPSR